MTFSLASAGRCSLLASSPSSQPEVADETAVVLWNPNTHTEHLVDRVTFGGQISAPFAYIIPTPVAPRIESTSDDPTRPLNRAYHPKFVYVENTGIQPVSGRDWIRDRFLRQKARKSAPAPQPAQDDGANADYQAVTFRAADTAGLSAWLDANGFAENPGLEKWLKPYAFRRWAVTAFLIDPGRGIQKTVRTPAFTLAFRSYRPYFPSREPADSHSSGRLRIYLVADTRMTASPSQRKDVWNGSTRWATPLPKDLTDPLNSDIADEFGIQPEQLPPHPWLTVLQDDTPDRGGASDLLFTPAPRQEAQPPIIRIPIDRRIQVPTDLCAIGIGLLVTLGVIQRAARRAKARRRRQAKAAAALAARNRIYGIPPAEEPVFAAPPPVRKPAPSPASAPPRRTSSPGPGYKKTRKRSQTGLRAFLQRLLRRKPKQAQVPPRRASAANLIEPWNGQPATSVKRSELLAEVLERQPWPPEADATPWIEIPTLVTAPKSFSVAQAEPSAQAEPGPRIPVWIKGEEPARETMPEAPVLIVHPPKRSPFKRRRRTGGDAYFPEAHEEDIDSAANDQ